MSNTESFNEQVREVESLIDSLRKELNDIYIQAVRDGNYKVVDKVYEEFADLSSIEFKLDKLKMFHAKNHDISVA